MVLMFVVGVIALIGSIVIYSVVESNDAAEAKIALNSMMKVASTLQSDIDNMRLSYVKAKADTDELRAAIAGQNKKIEWLELKSTAKPAQPAFPNKIHVSLDQPVKAEVSGINATPIEVRYASVMNTKERKALRKKVKTQIKRLSK